MIIKIIISCYPSFTLGTTWGLRASLHKMGGAQGDRLLEVMHSNTATDRHGFGFDHNGNQYLVYPSTHCYLSMARNTGANSWSGSKRKRQFIDDCDGILFTDGDHSYEPEQVEALVNSGYPVIAAAYPLRTDREPLNSCYEAGYLDPVTGGIVCRVAKGEVGIRRVDWVGGGFVYVKSKVFEVMEYPWFRRGVIDCGEEADELGEDIGFCLQCKRLDIPVHVDCDNVVGHHK